MEVLARGPITVRQDRLKVATVVIAIINDTLTIFRHIFVIADKYDPFQLCYTQKTTGFVKWL